MSDKENENPLGTFLKLPTIPIPKCKCGAMSGLFVDGDKWKCPVCLMKERDELLAALKVCPGIERSINYWWREIALPAINKAEGRE